MAVYDASPHGPLDHTVRPSIGERIEYHKQMSDLTFTERAKLEQLFGMASGYVLNFSNRSFAEFVLESTGLDIYNPRYDNASGSKAHRLRMFWQKEDNRLVGKLTGDMLDYLGESGPRVEICRLIVARLTGTATPSQAPQGPPVPLNSQVSAALSELRQEFSDLATEKDRAKAGFALEKLLHRLFVLFELHPRQPSRVVGG